MTEELKKQNTKNLVLTWIYILIPYKIALNISSGVFVERYWQEWQ